MANNLIGFENFVGSFEVLTPHITGKVPTWLQGTYTRAGMGQYTMGNTKMHHWFDGYALLSAFQFKDGQVNHKVRFVESNHYQASKAKNQIVYWEFGTPANLSWLQKFFLGKKALDDDNTNVNVIPNQDRLLAFTETAIVIEIEQSSLSTLGHIKYPDNLNMLITTAHPHFDQTSNQLINLGFQIGRKNYYCLYSMDLKTYRRTVIATIPVKQFGYQHSFALTDRYIIIIDQAFVMKPLALLWNAIFTKTSYIDNYNWQPQLGNRFLIIEKATGKLVKQLECNAFFIFHTINAYEHGNEIILDACVYEDPSAIDALYLKNIQKKLKLPNIPTYRFQLPLQKGEVNATLINNQHWEFPRINYGKHNGRKYQYFYGVNFLNGIDMPTVIFKHDLNGSNTLTWQENGIYVGEPLFVAKPDGKSEDEGVVMSMIIDTNSDTSGLLILDGITFTEVARLEVPHIIPFGLHGNFNADY